MAPVYDENKIRVDKVDIQFKTAMAKPLHHIFKFYVHFSQKISNSVFEIDSVLYSNEY